MENNNFLERLATVFGQSASVKNVYGEPIKAGDKTIIPVARIAYGLGGGHGQGKTKENASSESGNGLREGEGGGGGGGIYAKPLGVYEITGNSSRFIPVNNTRQLVAGLIIGYLVRSWFCSKRKQPAK